MRHTIPFFVISFVMTTCTPPPPVVAHVAGPERVAAAVTVYNGGRALIKDTRRFSLLQGTNDVRFDEVTSGIIPGSVSVDAAEGEVAVHEQNFEYDLVSTQRLLQRYLDQQVRVTAQSGDVHEGILMSASGDVILQAADGGITVLRLEQVRDLEFPGLPEGLASRPSLRWSLDSDAGGERDLTVTYLSTGFGWSADYVVTLADEDDAVDLSGWVSVVNNSEATFDEAHLKLVAGDVNILPVSQAVEADKADYSRRASAKSAEESQPVQRSFFDYHLYEMPRPVTLRSRENKQVEFVDVGDVPAAVSYELEYDGHWWGETVTRHPAVAVDLLNGEEQGLGMPLPAGIVRVYKKDVDGASELVGESRIDHTPKDEKVHLKVGHAFDLVGEWRLVSQKEISWYVHDATYEVVLRNHKTEDVTIQLVQHPYRWGQWRIRKASHEGTKKDNNTLTFDVPVEADGETTVTYTIRTQW